MCGFIGILSDKAAVRGGFEAGLAAIYDRGVSVDRFESGGEQYGYVRLPTDDVSNEVLGEIAAGASKLFFNGLLTNVDYLAQRFSLPAEARRSDAVCLRLGLEQDGAAFLQRCRGMFAIGLVTAEVVMLVRDTIGVKPLYYAYEGGTFAFASELKALRALGLPVCEVAPGQIVRYERATQEVVLESFAYENMGEYTPAELEACLTEAIVVPTRRYLEDSDKSVAVLLSGGVDSSITAGVLAANLSLEHKQRLVAFCIGDEGSADLEAAQKLARQLELTFVRVRPHSAEVSLRRLPEIVYAVESPYARVAKVGLLYDALAQEIKRQGIDVVIGGEGADELFHGYHRFIDGLTHEQSGVLFGLFFAGIFPSTLLRRYDRIFARRQIEGRVPYLDQEVVALAGRIESIEKVRYEVAGHTSKLPLRALAKKLGLPAYIYDRAKEKMTSGATGKPNEARRNGYLEAESYETAGVSFEEATQMLYGLQFGKVLVSAEGTLTEEAVSGLAAGYRMLNKAMESERSLA